MSAKDWGKKRTQQHCEKQGVEDKPKARPDQSKSNKTKPQNKPEGKI